MDSTKFDDLTKALATSTSRRQALRRIGGILGGTALAGLFPGLALASNSACAHFCNVVFGGDTPASAQCASDAAHGKGLCYTCGPASPGGTQRICCPKNGSGYCSSYTSATCCTSGQVCQNGTCGTPCVAPGGTCSADAHCCDNLCCVDTCCAPGQFCDFNHGTCVSCIPNGDFCLSSGACCSGLCNTVQDRLCVSCFQRFSGICHSDSDCCVGLHCDAAGICM